MDVHETFQAESISWSCLYNLLYPKGEHMDAVGPQLFGLS